MTFTLKHGVILGFVLAFGLTLYLGGAAWANRKVQEFKAREVIVYRPDPQQEKLLQQLQDERDSLSKKDLVQQQQIVALKNEIFNLKGSVEQENAARRAAEAKTRELELTLSNMSRPNKPEAVVIENPDEPDHEVRNIVRNQGLMGFTKRNAVWVVDEWFPAMDFTWPPAGMKANLEVNGNVLAAKGDTVTLIRVKYRVAGQGAFDQDCYIKKGVFFAYFDRTTKLLNLVPR